MANHHPLTAFLIVFNFIAIIICIVFSTISFTGVDKNLFPRGVGRSDSRQFPSEIDPSAWAFGIWAAIFLTQIMWSIYTVSLIFRKNRDGKEYIYYDPPFLPASFYAINIIAVTLATSWLFLFEVGYLAAAYVSLAGAAIGFWTCVFFSTYLLWCYEDRLSVSEIWFNVLLLQNGLGLFAIWSVIASLLQLSSTLVADAGMDKADAGTICLSLLLASFLIFACVDIFISSKRLRYFLAPYIVVVYAVVAIVDKHRDVEKRNTIFTIVILGVAILVSIFKLVSLIYRHVKQPLRIELMCCQ